MYDWHILLFDLINVADRRKRDEGSEIRAKVTNNQGEGYVGKQDRWSGQIQMVLLSADGMVLLRVL